jgi:hypothetical protein
MTRLLTPTLLLLLVLVFTNGCAPSEANQPAPRAASLSFQEIETPAASGSGEPNLHVAPGGDVFLSWVEPGAEARHALRFARLEEEAWSAPQTIAQGDDWFVNWADFPSLVALDPGSRPGQAVLAAHFLARSGPDTYAYDVQITRSEDGGRTWGPAVRPHRDGTLTEHGFVSMLPWREDRFLAVWLDGRNTGGHGEHGGGAMTLRTATLDRNGDLHDEAALDERVCDCCSTAAARTPHGAVVVYRDRSDEEQRDIALVRLSETGWSTPRAVHEDGWQIAGCPVNGPAVATVEANVAVAWFTAAQDMPRVKVAFSPDEGATFGPPTTVDDGQPVGRVDVVVLADGSALISWIEKTADAAEIRVRRVHPDGTRAPSTTVASTAAARASGFPHLARSGRALYLAWTDPADPSTIRTAVATL